MLIRIVLAFIALLDALAGLYGLILGEAWMDANPIFGIVIALVTIAVCVLGYPLIREDLRKPLPPTDSLEHLPMLVEAYVKKEIAADTRPTVPKEHFLHAVHDVMRVARDALTEKFTREQLPQTLQQLEISTGQKDLIRYFGSPFVDALAKYLGKLPAYVSEPAIFHAKLAEIPHYKAMEDFFFTLKDTAHNWIYSTYQQRWFEVQRATNAKFYDWGGTEFYGKLTEKVPFEKLFDQHSLVPITIPLEHRFRGVYILGAHGTGKTTLISALLKVDLALVEKGGASVILMDSKGDLVDAARQLRSDRIVLIEPTPDLAINPLDIGATDAHAVEMLEYLFAGIIETKPTELQLSLLRVVLMAMLSIPNATLDTMRDFLAGDWKTWDEYLKRMHHDDYKFFTSGKYDSKTYEKTKTELDWRIQNLLTKNILLRDMFKAPYTKIKMGELMDAGRLIIIDNSKAKLSEPGAEFFARFFLFLTLNAAQQRAKQDEDERLPCFLYIDECQNVIARDNNMATLINECRSMKVGVVLAHQNLSQIKSMDVRSALFACAVRFVSTDEEAPEMAANMHTKPEFLRSLKEHEFALFMDKLTKHPLTIKAAPNPVSKWPRLNEAEMKERRLQMKRDYCYQPETPKAPVEEDTSPQPWKR